MSFQTDMAIGTQVVKYIFVEILAIHQFYCLFSVISKYYHVLFLVFLSAAVTSLFFPLAEY